MSTSSRSSRRGRLGRTAPRSSPSSRSPDRPPRALLRRRAARARSLVAVEIRRETVQAAFAAEAGLAVTPERTRGIEAVVGVRPDDAGPEPLRHPEDARALLRPHAGGEAVRRVVRLLDRLLGRAEGEHAEDGAEDLFLRDPVALRDVGEDRRRKPVAALGEPARRLVDLGALGAPCSDELLDLLELLTRVDRADVRVLVERVADA